MNMFEKISDTGAVIIAVKLAAMTSQSLFKRLLCPNCAISYKIKHWHIIAPPVTPLIIGDLTNSTQAHGENSRNSLSSLS